MKASPRFKDPSVQKAETRVRPGFRFFFSIRRSAIVLALCTGFGVGCSIMETRPVQEMSDTVAAIRAAREVQADILAPELFRQSTEWFIKAKREYRFKNFRDAKIFADRSRKFAEHAEFESRKSGGTPGDASGVDPTAEVAPPPSMSAASSGGPGPASAPPDSADADIGKPKSMSVDQAEQAQKDAATAAAQAAAPAAASNSASGPAAGGPPTTGNYPNAPATKP